MEKPLTELGEGKTGIITKLSGGSGSGQGVHGRGGGGVKQLENLGIRVGKSIKIVSIQPFGPIVVEIDNHRVGIGRGRAAKIYVELENP
ncbi:hypothetical protein BEH94_09430 [Candidatus Altiarchaeales archaeon WOR_SM1_SCG]|nr:hypothetical protein BEH94_09430 [Candidatus Altiarchaeales archaeon WOR_SM1_SCG]